MLRTTEPDRASMRRLAVVAESSLLIDAIALGLRQGGEFVLVVEPGTWTTSAERICQARPDIVLLDDMERGPEVIELICALHILAPATPLLVLTMLMEQDWLDAVFAAGATGAIAKSTNPATLSMLLRETLNGHVLTVQPSGAVSVQRPAKTPTDSPLTARELEILRLIAEGSTNGEIARQLWVTEQTVKFHLSNVYRKLGVTNRTEASHYAHLNGMVAMVSPEVF
jgi:DNA-binding NarL/FixJ family response regulator